jgi:hypothetical protein
MAGETPQRFAPPRLRDEGWMVGELVEHGAAPYLNDPTYRASYYVRIRTLETEEGARRAARLADEANRTQDGQRAPSTGGREGGGMRIAWGKDLERAIKRSQSHVQIGQIVGVRRREREPVYGPDSQVIPGAYRNRFEVERVQFIQQRQVNAQKVLNDRHAARREGVNDPVVRALDMILAGAERLAALRYPDPKDQERFVAGVKRALELSPQREALISQIAQRLPANQKLNDRVAAAAEGAKIPEPAAPVREGFTRE